MPTSSHAHLDTPLRLLLRALRRDKKLTQKQLAQALGRPQSFVAKYEAGARELSVVEWLDILEVLGSNPGPFLRALAAAGKLKPKRSS